MGLFDRFRDKSSVDRYVSADSSEQHRMKKVMKRRHEGQIFPEFVGAERGKTPDEIKIIGMADKVTDALRKEYGLEPYHVSDWNYHVIRKDRWRSKYGYGYHSAQRQEVAIRETDSKVEFMVTALHEMLHFKSFLSVQPQEGAADDLGVRRSGLLAVQSEDGRPLFGALNEAVTEELTKRLVPKMIGMNRLFDEELKASEALREKHKDGKDAAGRPLVHEDAYLVSERKEKGKTIMESKAYTYRSARKALGLLVDKLHGRNKDDFKDREEVFGLFVKGALSGRLLVLARVIEKTFGKGTLRKIGEFGRDGDGLLKFVESL
jgi:hypothetical protein